MTAQPLALLTREEAAPLLNTSVASLKRWIRDRRNLVAGAECPPYLWSNGGYKFRADLIQRYNEGVRDLQGLQTSFPPVGDPSLQGVASPVAAPPPLASPSVAVTVVSPVAAPPPPAPSPSVAVNTAQLSPLEEALQKIDQWREAKINRAYKDHWDDIAPAFRALGPRAVRISELRYRLTQPGMNESLTRKLAAVLGVPRGDPAVSVPAVWHGFKQAYADIERHVDRFRRKEFRHWPETDSELTQDD